MDEVHASAIARRRTEEARAEAFFLCARRRRRRIHSAMREQHEICVSLELQKTATALAPSQPAEARLWPTGTQRGPTEFRRASH